MEEKREEKFISIDYETWENKYKIADTLLRQKDSEIQRLNDDLDNLKTLEIKVRWGTEWFARTKVGVIEISTPRNPKFNQSDIDFIAARLRSELRLDEAVTQKELKEAIQKKEGLLDLIDSRLAKVPRFLRWIFKL